MGIQPKDIQEAFLNLIQTHGGFEMAAWLSEGTIYAGGKGNVVWYIELWKKKELWRIGHREEDGKWTDKICSVRKIRGGSKTYEEGENGSTLEHAARLAFYRQEEIDDHYPPMKVLDADTPTVRYTQSFGALAWNISVNFGVTLGYSDVQNPSVGYRVKSLLVGKKVKRPNMP